VISTPAGQRREKEKERSESVGRQREKGKGTNHQQVRNALSYVCLAGSHFESVREEALAILDRLSAQASPDISQFIILLSNTDSLSFRGLYTYDNNTLDDPQGPYLRKIYGRCPKIIPLHIVNGFIKYETSSKSFKKLPTKSITTTTDAVSVDAQKLKKLVNNTTNNT